MGNLVENVLPICNGITWLMQVGDKPTELRLQLQQVGYKEGDTNAQLNEEEINNPCRKRKQVVNCFFERARSFKMKANMMLANYERQSKWKRIWMLPCLDSHLSVGKGLLDMADQLQREGLTYYEVCTRGVKLPAEKLIGKTANELRSKALESIRRGTRIIGIHGNVGSGKTNLMKVLHNDVFDDSQCFKAVFWAGAPEGQPDVKSIQECLAHAMRFNFEDEDMVRRGSLLAKRLKDMAPGHVVLFLDNVKEEFLTYNVGIPVGADEAEDFCCTLVFTATSEDVCNRMRCSSDSKFKMDLLPEDEARDLFLHEAGWNTCSTRSYDLRIRQVADDVARHCARMPLVIILIARSMTGKEDICEWRNRLNELMGDVDKLHDDEAKILAQLKFSFSGVKDGTVQCCFLASAKVLEGHENGEMPGRELIEYWIDARLIGKRHCRGIRGGRNTTTYDQGQTIINELQRVYLLEVVKLDGNGMEVVRMNKWIRKLAESIGQSR